MTQDYKNMTVDGAVDLIGREYGWYIGLYKNTQTFKAVKKLIESQRAQAVEEYKREQTLKELTEEAQNDGFYDLPIDQIPLPVKE